MLFEKEEEEEEEYLGETKKISLPGSEGGRDIAFHLGWNERLVEWDIKLDLGRDLELSFIIPEDSKQFNFGRGKKNI